MKFARKVWKLLVAIKDGLVLILMLGFFGLLYAALTMRPGPAQVRDGALLLKLDGAVVEEPSVPDPLTVLISGTLPAREYRARDLVRSLRAAAKDDRVKAVVLDLSGFTGGGLVHLQEVGAALDTVRAAKKPVLAWGMLYSDPAVMLAAHSSEVWVDPLGGALILGPGGNSLYFGGLIEKLKVNAHVFRVGTFKDFVEQYTRTGASPESKQARQAVYDALWEAWRADVAKARPKADIALATTDPAAWVKASDGDIALAAKQAGLVDRIGTRVEFGERVAELVGPDPFDDSLGSFAHTPLATWVAANGEKSGGKPIGVITIAGEIVDGGAGPGAAGGERIANALHEALDQDLAGLVIRVDSPGGSVNASEEIRKALMRYKDKKIPIAVSMANMAASGGYWVSTPGQRIFAEPGTITGSIGIFAVIPTFERSLAELGVTSDGVRTTPISGQPDPLGGLTLPVEQILQANIENGYARFIGLVAKARGKTPAQVDAIAQGRVWDGGTARQLGLVDQFGGLDEALAWVAAKAKLGDDWHPVFLGQDRPPYAGLIDSLLGGSDTDAAVPADLAALVAGRQRAIVGQAADQAERLLDGRGAQALCLDCPTPVSGRDRAAGSTGLLLGLARLIGL